MSGEQQTRVRNRRQRHTYLQEEQDDAFRVLLESRGAEIPENLQRKRISADPADNTQNTGTSKRQRHNPRLQGSTTATSSRQTTIPVPSTRSPSPEPRVFSRSPSPPRPPSPTLDPGEPPVLEVPLPPRQFPVKMSIDFPDDAELLNQGLQSPLENLKIAAEFIKLLDNATLDSEHSGMDQDDVEMLRNPRQTPSIPEDQDGDNLGDLAELIECPHFWKCLRLYLATVGKGASEESYKATIETLAEFYQDDPTFSIYQIRRRMQILTGIIPIWNDMCDDSCIGFTGPFHLLENCPECTKARYHPNTRKPIKQFLTVPTTPWLQAFYRSVKTAELMHYRERETTELLKYAAENQGRIRTYNDTICGKNYLDAIQAGKIRKQDIVLQASQDGAQIYQDKDSDCWFAIHIIHNLSPHLRYKKQFVMPTTIVPGPKKPKNIDSFMFPSAYHIAAVQNEGFRYWDAYANVLVEDSVPVVWMETADGPAMADWAGLVGHRGRQGCRLYCGLPGRRRNHDGHYYPALLKPVSYTVNNCLHPDVTITDLRRYSLNTAQRYHDGLKSLLYSQNLTNYNSRRLETGIVKQTLVSGLPSRPDVPDLFVLDSMHWSAINKFDEMLSLWRGTINVYQPDMRESWDWAVLQGKLWDAHGETIARSAKFLPSSFGRPPRNIAKKINTKYKASEKTIYLYGLAPPFLRNILPKRYWLHFCKYVAGSRLLLGWEVSMESLIEGDRLLCEANIEFEQIYIQRMESRLHFARQSMHIDTHIAREIVRYGPPSCYSQYTMETAVGNLGRERKQDRFPYMNIAQGAILRAHVNALAAEFPEKLLNIDSGESLPQGSKEVGGGYVLLRPREDAVQPTKREERDAIAAFWRGKSWPNVDGWLGSGGGVKRWGRMRLPNGQICRSTWSERNFSGCRKTCNVKIVSADSSIWFGEVRFYFNLSFGIAEQHALCLVSLYTQSDEDLALHQESLKTVYRCSSGGDTSLRVLDVRNIKALVAMVPDFEVDLDGNINIPVNHWILVEKPFLETGARCGVVDEDKENEGEDE